MRMRNIDFPLIFDMTFYAVGTWFLFVGVLRFARVPLAITVIAATLVALAVACAAFLLIHGRHKKRALTKEENKRMQALLLHLALDKEENVRLALLAAFNADGKSAHCAGGKLTVDGENVAVHFTMQPLSADDAAVLLKEYGQDPFLLVCNELSPEAERLLASFARKTMKGREVFDLFERTGMTPDPLILGDVKRLEMKDRVRRALNKRNARPIFFSAIALLAMSLFTFFPIYYLVTGSVLLLASVLVRTFGYA